MQIIELEPPVISEIESGRPGPHVSIMVGVHGNEKAPILIWDWLCSLEIEAGKLTLIHANPTASRLNRRYCNINLNRRFGMNRNDFPEDALARKIESILEPTTALLDLHMYNEPIDAPFIICGNSSIKIAQTLPGKFLITGWSDTKQGASDDLMTLQGKHGITFECGSVVRPKKYLETAKQASLWFLFSQGLITQQPSTPVSTTAPQVLQLEKIHVRTGRKFSFTQEYASFDVLRKGEHYATEDDTAIVADRDCRILFPRPNNPIGDESFMLLKRVTAEPDGQG